MVIILLGADFLSKSKKKKVFFSLKFWGNEYIVTNLVLWVSVRVFSTKNVTIKVYKV